MVKSYNLPRFPIVVFFIVWLKKEATPVHSDDISPATSPDIFCLNGLKKVNIIILTCCFLLIELDHICQ